jgi:hypothetical protein
LDQEHIYLLLPKLAEAFDHAPKPVVPALLTTIIQILLLPNASLRAETLSIVVSLAQSRSSFKRLMFLNLI